MSISKAEEYANCKAARSTSGFESKQTGHARGQTSIAACASSDKRDGAESGEKGRHGAETGGKGRHGMRQVYLTLQLLHALSGDLLL